MNTKRFLLAGFAGGITAFFAGYLIYGILLMDVLAKHTMPGIARAETDMIWWALIVGCMFSGFFISYIFNCHITVTTAGRGAVSAFIIYFLISASFGLISYANTSIYTLEGVCIDVPAGALMGALTGAVVGLVNGMIKTKS